MVKEGSVPKATRHKALAPAGKPLRREHVNCHPMEDSDLFILTASKLLVVAAEENEQYIHFM